MHELNIAGNIADMVRREMSERGLSQVEAISLRLGRMTDVNPDALSFGFGVITRDTELAGAKLIIEEIPVAAKCHQCEREFDVPEFSFSCPSCGSNAVRLIRGMELEIASLEVVENTSATSL
ncbi:MAG: hydrogenase maturation nickel metallochaperone HypA [candidate division Zixibacteria bacterium]|nr:hydrogenase maturation nickel metallochaperone HypA [candidate division Zixibacteria bacterium]